MKEIMPMQTAVTIIEQPIKTNGAQKRPFELLQAQAERAQATRVAVDYEKVRGTCVDERPREHAEARPSVAGGPDIYGLYIAELTGYFGERDDSPKARLVRVKHALNNAKLISGGHEHCAAAAKFGGVLSIIAQNPEAVSDYAQQNRGETYDPSAMDEVISNAQRVTDSGRYEGVSMEEVLAEVYGDMNEGPEAIEGLIGEHEGITFIRQKEDGHTVDQTVLHEAGGEDSFIFDDPYAEKIENVFATGPNAARVKVVAEHAREAVLAAVANAVPNQELYQINLN